MYWLLIIAQWCLTTSGAEVAVYGTPKEYNYLT